MRHHTRLHLPESFQVLHRTVFSENLCTEYLHKDFYKSPPQNILFLCNPAMLHFHRCKSTLDAYLQYAYSSVWLYTDLLASRVFCMLLTVLVRDLCAPVPDVPFPEIFLNHNTNSHDVRRKTM